MKTLYTLFKMKSQRLRISNKQEFVLSTRTVHIRSISEHSFALNEMAVHNKGTVLHEICNTKHVMDIAVNSLVQLLFA